MAFFQYPAGYQKEKENKNEVEVEEATPSKAKRKRKSQGSGKLFIFCQRALMRLLQLPPKICHHYTLLCSTIVSLNCFFLSESPKTSPAKLPKKIKVEQYKLTREQKALIKKDEANKKVWGEAMESLSLGPVRIAVYLVELMFSGELSACGWEASVVLCNYINTFSSLTFNSEECLIE